MDAVRESRVVAYQIKGMISAALGPDLIRPFILAGRRRAREPLDEPRGDKDMTKPTGQPLAKRLARLQAIMA